MNIRISSVYCEITSECNYSCVHCYNDSGIEGKRLSLESLKRLILELSELKVPSFTISGGEPLLHPEIREIIAFLYQNGIAVDLVTNGSLLSIISDMFHSIRSIQISLDGACSSTHDFIRGRKGSFNTVVSQISKLDEVTLSKITLKMVMNAYNKDEILAYLRLVESLRIHRVSFGWLNNLGRAKFEKKLTITDVEKLDLIDQINEQIVSNTNLEIVPVGTTDLCPYVNEDKKTTIDMNLRIDSNGDIFPCQLISCSKFILGNINQIKLCELSNSNSVNQFFDYARERQKHISECKNCVWQSVCKGGCIGDGMTDENLYLPDGQCCLRKMSFCKNIKKRRK